MGDMQGQTAWITGASSGLGDALAAELFARGARLVLSGRDEGNLGALARRLLSSSGRAAVRIQGGGRAAASAPPSAEAERTEGPQVLVRPFDVSSRESIASAVEEVTKHFGGVDLLIHAAGVSQRSLAVETDRAVVRRIMETDFFGPVEMTMAMVPRMLAAGGGRIVVVSSVFGKFGAPTRSSYAAAKHALHGFFDSLRCELPRASVRITLVVPGAIATNISTNALTADGSPFGAMDEAIARGMSPERCAKKIVRAILRDRDEVRLALGVRARFALLLKQVAPRLLTHILRRARIT